MFRSDFLWRSKLNSEQEGVDTMRGINKILLENILPAHVAEHYLLRAQGVAGVLRDTNVRKIQFGILSLMDLNGPIIFGDSVSFRACYLDARLTKG